MKTKAELENLQKEMSQLKSKLVELTDDELAMVTGGQGVGMLTKNLTFINLEPLSEYNSTFIFKKLCHSANAVE